MKDICRFVAQFDSLRFTKDGGGKITLEFGMDAIKELQKIQDWSTKGNLNFALAISPLDFNDAYEHENIEY